MRSLIISRGLIFLSILTAAAFVYAATEPTDPRLAARQEYVMNDVPAAQVTELEADTADAPEVVEIALDPVPLEWELGQETVLARPRSPFVLGNERWSALEAEETAAPQAARPRVLAQRTAAPLRAYRSARSGASPWKSSYPGAGASTLRADRDQMFRPFEGKSLFKTRSSRTYGSNTLTRTGSSLSRANQTRYFREWWE